MKIKIYQINNVRDEKNALFLSYEQLEKFTGSRDVNSSIYDKVYEGDVDCRHLESVYQMFNMNRPPEFTGHSLSKSDIVEIVDDMPDLEKGFYYCDSIGFKKIAFEPEKTQEKDVRKIKVVMVEPEKEARIVELEDDLKALQHAVQGYIETMYPFAEEVAIICNEEGKMTGLPLNRAIYMEGDHSFNPEIVDIIAGNFFICATPAESENFESLTDEQASKYLEMFRTPEKFYRVGDEIVAIPVKPTLDDAIAEYKKQVDKPRKPEVSRDNERDM